jgi:Mrp family chromosome partitioning ATPase
MPDPQRLTPASPDATPSSTSSSSPRSHPAAPVQDAPSPGPPVTDPPVTDLLVIGGRSGVGKSTVAYEISRLLADDDVRHAVIEGDTLDQAHPEPWRHGIAMAQTNLRSLARNYRAHDYTRLVYTNTVSVLEMDGLIEAIGVPTRAVGILLRADDRTIGARLSRREVGASLALHVERSRRRSRELDQEAPPQVHRIDTDGLDPEQVARAVLAAAHPTLGWPIPVHPPR